LSTRIRVGFDAGDCGYERLGTSLFGGHKHPT
jgi:hypothetical protein